jgi:hypothetical protein
VIEILIAVTGRVDIEIPENETSGVETCKVASTSEDGAFAAESFVEESLMLASEMSVLAKALAVAMSAASYQFFFFGVLLLPHSHCADGRFHYYQDELEEQ